MSNLLLAEVEIRGTRPLLWHAFTEEALPLEKKERDGVAGNQPSEWKMTVLATPEGQLYVPASYVFATVRDGARHVKKGRGSIQPSVAATLQVREELVLLDRFLPDGEPPRDPTRAVYLDVRGVRNPSTKARNLRYRVAASAGWGASFGLLWDRTVVSRQELEAALRDAGMLAGIGDGRSIGMGRFAVDRFDVAEC
jgi:hypothetical protein